MPEISSLGLLRYAFVVAVGVAVLSFGSATRFAFAVSSFLVCLVWLLAALRLAIVGSQIPRSVLWPVRHSVLIAIAITVFGTIQVLPLGSNSLLVPSATGDLIPATGISLSPSATIAAIPHFLTPIGAFGAACLLYGDDRSAVRFLRILAIFGGLVCIVGILQFTLTPDRLLLSEKLHYRVSLTAAFVNRNTAATFCGMVLVLSLGLLFHELMSRKWLVSGIVKGLDQGVPLLPALLAGAAAASFLCLLLTKSRAGVFFSTLIALLFLLVYWTRRMHLTGGWSIRNSVIGLGFFLSIGALIDLLGGRTLVRLEVSGIASARWCSYNSAMKAIQDHWLLGTGLGSFFDVFPMYKDIECGIFGEWEYLHNVYLEAAFSGGIVLLAISAYAVGVLVFYLARGIVRRQRYQFLPWTGLLILVLVLLHSSLDFSIQINGIAVFTSAALAAAVAISNSRPARTEGEIALSPKQSKSAAVSGMRGAMVQ